MQSPYQRISASKSTFLPWMPASTLLPWITVMHTPSTDRCVHLPLLTCIHTCIYLETVCPHIYRIWRCIPVCSHVSKVAQWIYASMVDACVETPYKVGCYRHNTHIPTLETGFCMPLEASAVLNMVLIKKHIHDSDHSEYTF